MTFDPTCSPIQRDSAQLASLLAGIETILPATEVVGLVEIGSYAKGEAVPTSDTDTRAYVRSNGHLNAIVMTEQEEPIGSAEWKCKRPGSVVNRIPFDRFNRQLRSRLHGRVENAVSVGFIDTGHAEILFGNLDRLPSQDHSMLFQSTIVYDPKDWIARRRSELTGKVTPALVEMYRHQVVRRAQNQLPWYAENAGTERGAHQWLLKAVRCVRETISLKSFAATGEFRFVKRDVLASIEPLDGESRALVEQLYEWKCDPALRAEIASSVARGDSTWPQRYRELTPAVQEIVNKVLSDLPDHPHR